MQNAQLRRTVTLKRSKIMLVGAVAQLSACGGAEARDTITGATSTISISAIPVAESATPVTLEQPAVWPAAGVVFESPEAAAEDFVANVLGEGPAIGEFQQGDTGSGEIVVFSTGETGSGPLSPRGLLLLRQLGPEDGWFVTTAVNENASITVPALASEVPAGPLAVEGVARGYEGTLHVTAFRAGDADAVLDQVLARGGAWGPPEPYTVTLDLSDASPGDVVVLLVRGDSPVGPFDPGEFSAIPVVISPDQLVETL